MVATWVPGRVVLVAALVLAAGCGSEPPTGRGTVAAPAMPSKGTASVHPGERRVTVHIPETYHAGRPVPLVLLLHGYSSTGAQQESYLKFTPESDRRGFIYAYP